MIQAYLWSSDNLLIRMLYRWATENSVVVAQTVKLGSCEKRPAFFKGWILKWWHIPNAELGW